MTQTDHQTNRQQASLSFLTEEALIKAHSNLQNKALSSIQVGVVPPSRKAAPEQRTLKADTGKAAGLGGIVGAITFGMIVTVAQSVPNVSSIYDYATPLFVVGGFVGAAFGAAAGGAASFFAGKRHEPPANHQLKIEGSAEDIEVATQLLMDEGGRLM